MTFTASHTLSHSVLCLFAAQVESVNQKRFAAGIVVLQFVIDQSFALVCIVGDEGNA